MVFFVHLHLWMESSSFVLFWAVFLMLKWHRRLLFLLMADLLEARYRWRCLKSFFEIATVLKSGARGPLGVTEPHHDRVCKMMKQSEGYCAEGREGQLVVSMPALLPRTRASYNKRTYEPLAFPPNRHQFEVNGLIMIAIKISNVRRRSGPFALRYLLRSRQL